MALPLVVHVLERVLVVDTVWILTYIHTSQCKHSSDLSTVTICIFLETRRPLYILLVGGVARKCLADLLYHSAQESATVRPLWSDFPEV